MSQQHTIKEIDLTLSNHTKRKERKIVHKYLEQIANAPSEKEAEEILDEYQNYISELKKTCQARKKKTANCIKNSPF